MDRQLNFYEVSAEYISYLTRFDSKVPRIDYSAEGGHDKFLCGIVFSVNDNDYFAPISSFKTPQRTNMIIRNEENEAVSSIRFSFMIPVPPGAISVKSIKDEPSPKYRRLLELELRYCQKNANTIYRLAKHIYNTVVGQKDSVMVRNCCDFKGLEKACAEYIKTNPENAKTNATVNQDGVQQHKSTLIDKLAEGKAKAQEHNSRIEKKNKHGRDDPK